MSSLSDPKSDASLDSDTPIKPDGTPIRFNNPAEIPGCLDQLTKYFTRTQRHQPFLTKGVVLLNNGKTAIDSVKSVTFLVEPSAGGVVDPAKYTLADPCPPTEKRIKQFDANVGLGTPGYASTAFAPVDPSKIDMSNFVVNELFVN